MTLNPNGHPFFRFTFANLLTIVLILGMGVSWWISHESIQSKIKAEADIVNNTQTMLLAEHEKRFTQLQDQINELNKSEKEMSPKLEELLVKFRVMVELVDGGRKKPELHN